MLSVVCFTLAFHAEVYRTFGGGVLVGSGSRVVVFLDQSCGFHFASTAAEPKTFVLFFRSFESGFSLVFARSRGLRGAEYSGLVLLGEIVFISISQISGPQVSSFGNVIKVIASRLASNLLVLLGFGKTGAFRERVQHFGFRLICGGVANLLRCGSYY